MAGTKSTAATNVESQAQLRKEHEREIDSLKKKLKEAEFDKKTLRDEERKKAEEKFKKEIDEKSAELTEKTNKVRELIHENKDLSVKFADAKNTNSDLEKLIARDMTMKDVQRQTEENRDELDRMLGNLNQQLKNNLDNLIQADTGGLKREKEALASRNAKLSEKVECARSKTEKLTRDFEIRTKEVADLKETLKKKKNRKQECLEEERKRMQGLNNSYVNELVTNHEEKVARHKSEMEQLRASHDAEIKKIKGEFADVQRERANDQKQLEKEKQRIMDEYETFKRDFIESLKGKQEDSLKQKNEDIVRLKEEMQSTVNLHTQELSDKEAELEGLRLSDGEKMAELEASNNQLQHDLEKKIQENTIYINNLVQRHVKSESELREEKRVLERKIDELESRMNMMRSSGSYSAIVD